MIGENVRNYINFRKDPLAFLHLSHQTHGDRMSLQALRTKVHVFYTASAAQRVLLTKHRNYGRCNMVMDRIKPLTGDEGIIQLNGPRWGRLRQQYVEMLSPKELEKKDDLFRAKANEVLGGFSGRKEVDMLEAVSEYALMIALILFAGKDDLYTRDFYHQFLELNKICGSKMLSPVVLPSVRSYLTKRKLTRKVQSLLPSTPLRNDQTKSGREFLSDQIKTFLFASHETTTSSIVSAVYLLAKNVDVQQKYRSLNAAEKVTYIKDIYAEALRLYPPAWMVARTALEDDNELNVRKGDHVIISIREIHRNEDYWKRPDDFLPERHREIFQEKCQFIPFGAGPKKCIGPALAEFEATHFIRALLAGYRIFSDEQLEVKAHTTLIPLGPVNIRVEPLH